jgi:hypothetical protein
MVPLMIAYSRVNQLISFHSLHESERACKPSASRLVPVWCSLQHATCSPGLDAVPEGLLYRPESPSELLKFLWTSNSIGFHFPKATTQFGGKISWFHVKHEKTGGRQTRKNFVISFVKIYIPHCTCMIITGVTCKVLPPNLRGCLIFV